jgi:hypothetical protein
MAYVKQLSIKKDSHFKKCISYVSQNEKTELKLISGLNCEGDPDTIAGQFENTRMIWEKEDGVLAHHYVQSFKPGEVEAEKAHEIGKRLAEIIAPGYQVYIATHQDKEHIHNHIIINSVNQEFGYKYNNDKEQFAFVKEQSDCLCNEYGLSVIDNEQDLKRAVEVNEFRAKQRGDSYKDKIADGIKEALNNSSTKEEFCNYLESKNIKVNWKNTRITFQYENHKPVGDERLSKQYGNEYLKSNIEKNLGIEPSKVIDFKEAKKKIEKKKRPRNNEYEKYNKYKRKIDPTYEPINKKLNPLKKPAKVGNIINDPRKKNDVEKEMEDTLMILGSGLKMEGGLDMGRVKKAVNTVLNVGDVVSGNEPQPYKGDGKEREEEEIQFQSGKNYGNEKYDKFKGQEVDYNKVKGEAFKDLKKQLDGQGIKYSAFYKDGNVTFVTYKVDRDKMKGIFGDKVAVEKNIEGNIPYKDLKAKGEIQVVKVDGKEFAALKESLKGKDFVAYKQKDGSYNLVMQKGQLPEKVKEKAIEPIKGNKTYAQMKEIGSKLMRLKLGLGEFPKISNRLTDVGISFAVLQDMKNKESLNIIIQEYDKSKAYAEIYDVRKQEKYVSMDEKSFTKQLGTLNYNQIKDNKDYSTIKVTEKEYNNFKDSIEHSAVKDSRKDDTYYVCMKKTDIEKAYQLSGQKYQKQLGNVSYSDMKKLGDLQYRNVSEKMFKELTKTIAVSGFMQKDGSINIAFSNRELDKYNQIKEKFEQELKKKVEKTKQPKIQTPKKSKGLDR